MNAQQQLEYLRKNLWRFPIEGRPTESELDDAIKENGGDSGRERFPTAWGGYGATNQG